MSGTVIVFPGPMTAKVRATLRMKAGAVISLTLPRGDIIKAQNGELDVVRYAGVEFEVAEIIDVVPVQEDAHE